MKERDVEKELFGKVDNCPSFEEIASSPRTEWDEEADRIDDMKSALSDYISGWDDEVVIRYYNKWIKPQQFDGEERERLYKEGKLKWDDELNDWVMIG